ncbi:lysophospholipase L1-like esterase [Cerasibacillus quisquiliarum]|nr:SGNH/GDSL hydrolase family protein [Cerasibacillus quisquiliarum]MBB5146041.1 lysophospholipase L1-like esterase [Cerasibacillus quisquiliarum]
MKRKIFWFSILFIFLSIMIGVFVVSKYKFDTNVSQFKEKLVDQSVERIEENVDKSQSTTSSYKERLQYLIDHAQHIFANKPVQIVTIGDSLTVGVGDETKQSGYVGILNQTFQDKKILARIENLGKSGNRTDQLRKRLDNEDIAKSIEQADMIFITIGANDLMYVLKENITHITIQPFMKEMKRYEDRLRDIFTRLRELNEDAEIYLIGFYNPFEAYFNEIEELTEITKQWNEVGQKVTAHDSRAYFIPTADLFVGRTSQLLADDYFHPNKAGYEVIANRIIQFLNQMER